MDSSRENGRSKLSDRKKFGLGLCAILVVVGIVVAGVLSSGSQYCDCVLEDPPPKVYGTDADASAFFEASDVSLERRAGEGWWLAVATPEPVLCAVNTGGADADDAAAGTALQSMLMSSPVRQHGLLLEGGELPALLAAGARARLTVTAFLASGDVYRAVYDDVALDGDGADGEAAPLHLPPPRTYSLAAALPRPDEVGHVLAVEVGNVTDVSAEIMATTSPAVVLNFRIARDLGSGQLDDEDDEDVLLLRPSTTTPIELHELEVVGMSAETDYGAQITLIDAAGVVSRREPRSDVALRFETAEASTENELPSSWRNAALASEGGSIEGVSSNWGGQSNSGGFGADKAIDGRGNTAWSSAGDGTGAWIEVRLGGDNHEVVGVGFWSRFMTNSAVTTRFEARDEDGDLLVSCDVPDVQKMHWCALPQPAATATVRFVVADSNGGNVGAVEVAAFVDDAARR